jgi:ribulose-5-phosphate 4-epimerase/fuculose-1-phosphate aldolase
MSSVAGRLPPHDRARSPEQQGRVDLAAAFRWTARLGWHEAVANHFSLALSEDGGRFLVNPRWRHFARIRACDLLLLDADDASALEGPDAPDPTAWYIHAALHRRLPHARCILHAHMPYATALTTLADPEIRPIDQNTMRFFGRIAYDRDYGGLALSSQEGDRLAHALGEKPVLMMANHGVIVARESVAKAFDELYYLETAARTQVLACSTGRELKPVPDDLAARVAAEWEAYEGFSEAHFAELKAILDVEEPDYAD